MIEHLKTKNQDLILDLLIFIKGNYNEDFYLTENNDRNFIVDYLSLKRLLKQSNDVFVSKECSDVNGVIMTWKALGNSVFRKYVKINCECYEVGEKLLTTLLWNTNSDLHVKLKKRSFLLDLFKRKGFRFVGGRGAEVLLKREKFRGEVKECQTYQT